MSIKFVVVESMERRQNGWLFIIGIVLGVISNAWINSISKTVEEGQYHTT